MKGKADPLRVFEVEAAEPLALARRRRDRTGPLPVPRPRRGGADPRRPRSKTRAPDTAGSSSSRARPASGSPGSSTSSGRSSSATTCMWLTGRCISYGADIPYVPIVDLIKDAQRRSTRRTANRDGRREARAPPWRRSNGDPANLPYLRSLLSVDPGDPSIAEQDPTLRKARVFESFRDVLVSAASRRAVGARRSRTPTGSTRSRPNCSPSSIDSLPDHGVLLAPHAPPGLGAAVRGAPVLHARPAPGPVRVGRDRARRRRASGGAALSESLAHHDLAEDGRATRSSSKRSPGR